MRISMGLFGQSHGADLETLLETSLRESAKEAAKATAEKLTEHAFIELTAKLLTTTVSTAVGTIAGGAIGALVASLLKGVDENKALLRRLASEPYETGTRAIGQALNCLPKNLAEYRYQNDRLRFGVEKLESAFTLTESNDQRIFVVFLTGLAELALEGGLLMACGRFETAAKLLKERISETNEKLLSVGHLGPPLSETDPTIAALLRSDREGVGKPISVMTEQAVRKSQREYKDYLDRRRPHESRIRSLTYLLGLTEAIVSSVERNSES